MESKKCTETALSLLPCSKYVMTSVKFRENWSENKGEEKQDSLLCQWPLALITTDEQVSPPSIVSTQNTSHFLLISVGILFNSTSIGSQL